MTPDRAGSRLGRLARVSEVEAGDEVAARVEALRAEIAEHNRRYHDRGRADDLRRRVRRAGPRAAPLEDEFPELITPDSPTQQVGRRRRRCSPRSQHRLPMMSLDNAFSAERAAGVGRAAGAPPRRRAGRRPGRLRVRAEDRRRRHLAALRGRPARAGRHPRRRAGGRGRHRQHRHHRARSRSACRRARPTVLEVRGEVYMQHRRVRGAQRAPGRGRRAALRQPAQLRGRLAAPEGPAGHRQPRAVDVVLPARRGRGRPRVHQPPRDARLPAAGRACR